MVGCDPPQKRTPHTRQPARALFESQYMVGVRFVAPLPCAFGGAGCVAAFLAGWGPRFPIALVYRTRVHTRANTGLIFALQACARQQMHMGRGVGVSTNNKHVCVCV